MILGDPVTTNYAVAKASLHVLNTPNKKFEVMPFLDNFFFVIILFF